MDRKRAARNGMIYTVSALGAQAASMLLVPVYTRNMSPDDFGLYNLMISVQMLLSIFSTLGVASGLTRFFNEFEDKNTIKNTALTFVVLSGAVVTILVATFGDSVYRVVFSGSGSGSGMLLIIMLSTTFLAISNVYVSYYNMQEKAWINGVLNTGRSFALLIISVVLIVFMDMGLKGALLAQMFAYGGAAALLLGYDRKAVKFRISLEMLKPMLGYSAGLIPGQISSWVYSLIDRYFIKMMMGLASVGVYSMGFRLGALMEPLLLYPFKSVFTAFKYREYNREGAKERIREFFEAYTSIAWFVALGFSVFAKPAILLLSTLDYLGAVTVVPLIVIAYVLYGFDEFYAMGLHISNRSAVASMILATTAGVNMALNTVLIPWAGLHGAALATLISAVLMNLINFHTGKRFYDLKIMYAEGFKPVPLATSIYFLYIAVAGGCHGVMGNVGIACAACGLYLLGAYWLRIIPRKFYHDGYRMLMQRLGKRHVRSTDDSEQENRGIREGDC